MFYTQNNKCISCECYGNVDPQLGLKCYPNNGTCINCLNNTTGPNCAMCAIGYYGDIPNGTPCQGMSMLPTIKYF